MARIGVTQIAALTETVCGAPATDAATKMEQIRTSLRSDLRIGRTLVSAWGANINSVQQPVVGGAITPFGASIYCPDASREFQILFELPTLRSSGEITVADKFILSSRFVVCNYSGVSNGTRTADIFGNVRATIITPGGSQVLMNFASTEYAAVSGISGLSALSVSPSNFLEVSQTIEGTLSASVMPPIGQTYDAVLKLEIIDYAYDATPPTSGGDAFLLSPLPPYVGIAGATLKIFNPVA